MQRKPIANKYRKGTMKSTLHSTYVTLFSLGFFALHIQAPKGVKERVKSPYRITSLTIYIFTLRSHTHTHSPTYVWLFYINDSHFYMIQRSTIGQSVFASFLMVAGYYANPTLRCMSCYIQDATIRPVVTRTKEFNWIASRRVSHKARRQSESNIVPSTGFTVSTAAQADYEYA